MARAVWIVCLVVACAAPDPVEALVASPPGPPLQSDAVMTRAGPNPLLGRIRQAAPIDPHRLPVPLSFRASERQVDLPPPPDGPVALARASNFRGMFPAIADASLDDAGGEQLADRLAEFSPGEVNNSGVALLTQDELWGTEDQDYEDALCEPLHLTWPFEDGGKDYVGAGFLWQYTYFDGDLQPFLVDIGGTCANALDVSPVADVLDTNACTEDDLLSFFRDGTGCRACLDEGSGWSDCVAAERCAEEAPLVFWWYGYESGVQIPVEAHYGFMAACAPDWYTLALAMSVADDDPAMPAPWDNPSWIGYCYPYWEPSIDDIFFGCAGETLYDDLDEVTYAETVPFRLTGLTKGRSDFPAFWDRVGWASEIGFTDGRLLKSFWAGFGAGPVTAPLESGGWGVPPMQNRPREDGDALDDTYARDFVAALTLKQSTLQDGILISYFNQNRCSDDGWEGPDAQGRYGCTALEPLASDGWNYDGAYYWGDDAHTSVFAMPMITLGSTGLPDPGVPGGFAPHVASTPGYTALERWTYPDTFVPDLAAFSDAPESGGTDQGALVQETYRFGKDPDQDLRVIFATNWHRFHRPLGEAP